LTRHISCIIVVVSFFTRWQAWAESRVTVKPATSTLWRVALTGDQHRQAEDLRNFFPHPPPTRPNEDDCSGWQASCERHSQRAVGRRVASHMVSGQSGGEWRATWSLGRRAAATAERHGQRVGKRRATESAGRRAASSEQRAVSYAVSGWVSSDWRATQSACGRRSQRAGERRAVSNAVGGWRGQHRSRIGCDNGEARRGRDIVPYRLPGC
jgi:hypothetical protein